MTTFISRKIIGVVIGILSFVNASAQIRDNDPSTAPVVVASEPLITIHGQCEDPTIKTSAATNPCTTIVTREAFEELINSMNIADKAITSKTRRDLAETYAQYLIFERLATKAHLAGTPQFAEIMRWWRLRTLADLYRRNLQEQFQHSSDQEVHAYYVEHILAYERIRVARILVPRARGTTDEAKHSDAKALEEARLARERMAKGEDPALVQKDVYSALGIESLPLTDIGSVGRSGFPHEQSDELFSLGPGQVSKVEIEIASYVIYKITSKETLGETAVKDEISRQISQRKFDEAIRTVNESAKPEFNEAYFGPREVTPSAAYPGVSANPHP